MDKEKAREVYESISKNLKLRFSSYYKYSFSFNGQVDDVIVNVSYGEDSNDIYRFSVNNEEFEAPITFDELNSKYDYIIIKNSSGQYEKTRY